MTIFVVGAIFFVAFSTVIYRQYSDAVQINSWTNHYYEVLRLSRVVFVDVLNMETGARGYMMTGQKQFLQPYNESSIVIEGDENKLRQVVQDDAGIRQKIAPLFSEIDDFIVLNKSAIERVGHGGPSSITPQALEVQKHEMDHLRMLVDDFTQQGLTDLHNQLNISQSQSDRFLHTLVLGTVLALGAMLLSTMVTLTLAARSRKAEDLLRTGEERLLTVMNGVNDGLFDFDTVTKTMYYSPSYKSILGYTDEEYPNTLESFNEHIHPEDSEKTFEHSRRYQSRETPTYSTVFRMRHKDGSWRWVLSRGIGIWDAKGRMTRLIGTHTDITEQKKREEELEQLNAELESFTYITSHDLRSPLVNLRGFAGEMGRALKQADPVLKRIMPTLHDEERIILHESFEKDIPEALGFINKAVEKLDLLTSAVLDLSRIGKRELRMEILDTYEIARRSLDSLAFEIGKKEVDVICEPLPKVVSDPVALEQIFSNLLDNAVKYLSPERKGRIVISSQPAGRDVIFSIKDNGRGIMESDRSKVFEIFRRARNTGDVRGMGIGMAYVKATLRKLGGIIWFDSGVDVGTTFYFRIPANRLQTHLSKGAA